MIQLLPQLKILLAYHPVDFRKGIDGLIGLCRAHLDVEIYDGTLFVFRNRRGTALKILTFDGVGWWLVIRRFSQGRLQWWPKAQADTLTHPLEAQQLQVLLYNGLPERYPRRIEIRCVRYRMNLWLPNKEQVLKIYD